MEGGQEVMQPRPVVLGFLSSLPGDGPHKEKNKWVNDNGLYPYTRPLVTVSPAMSGTHYLCNILLLLLDTLLVIYLNTLIF